MSYSDDNSKRQEFWKIRMHFDYVHKRIQCLLKASVLVKRIKYKRRENDLPVYCLELDFNNKVIQHEKTWLFDSTQLCRGWPNELLSSDLSWWLTLSNIELEIIWIFNTAAFTSKRSNTLLFISNVFLMAWIYIDIIIVEWWALIFTLWHKQICRIFTMFHLVWFGKTS